MAAKKQSKRKIAPPKRKPATPKRTAAKKPVAKKRVAAKRVVAKPTVAKRETNNKLRRRDGTGHLDPQYAADLLERARESEPSDAVPFLTRTQTHDDLAEQLAESSIETATSGEDEGEDILDQTVPEEVGGPFVTTTGDVEFANGTDESNPKDATREPFPRT